MRTLVAKRTTVTFIIMLCITTFSYAQKSGSLQIESSESIKQLITKKKTYNKNIKEVDGYKVQIYYGSEEGAKNIRKKFKSIFNDVPTELKFTSPDWKIWVGAYKTRLEADRAIEEFKASDFNAIPVATKIRIK